MKLDAVSGDVAGSGVYAEQEGAFVKLSLESSGREDALMTPDQAERLAFALSEIAQEARKYGSEAGE